MTDEHLTELERLATHMAKVSMDGNRTILAQGCLDIIVELRHLKAAAEKNRIEGHDLWERTTYKIEQERDELRADVRMYKTALEFYAAGIGHIWAVDRGETARKALGEQ